MSDLRSNQANVCAAPTASNAPILPKRPRVSLTEEIVCFAFLQYFRFLFPEHFLLKYIVA